MKNSFLPCAIFAGLLSAPALAVAAPEWLKIAESPAAKLFVMKGSIRVQGDGREVAYRIDFPTAQKNPKTGNEYLSLAVQATLFCANKTIIRTEMLAYKGASGTGEVVGTYRSSVLTGAPIPIVEGQSDEDLRKYVCETAGNTAKPKDAKAGKKDGTAAKSAKPAAADTVK